MRLLAISFMLPPMLYPQAIQIGRLLEGSGLELATLNGRFEGDGMSPQGQGFRAEQHFIRRIEVPHRTLLNGMAHRLAMRLMPFYGRSPDEFLSWSRRAAEQASQWLHEDPDAVTVMATFGEPMSDHLVGLELKRRFGLPWLAHFSDPWSDNPFRKFQPLANLCNRRMEGKVIEAADTVVFTSEETRQLVMRKYPRVWLDKAFVLPHSFNPKDFSGIPRSADDGKIVLRYLGNFYGHRTPFPLFSSLARLASARPEVLQDVRVELVGSLPGWMQLHPAIKQLPAGLLSFCKSVSYQRSLELMTGADLLLVIDAPARNSVFLPSKLVDYIGSGKPILGIVPPGASHELIRRLGGETADPLASADIDAALVKAIQEARWARGLSEPWGNAEVRAEFDIERVAAAFKDMLQGTALKGRT